MDPKSAFDSIVRPLFNRVFISMIMRNVSQGWCLYAAGLTRFQTSTIHGSKTELQTYFRQDYNNAFTRRENASVLILACIDNFNGAVTAIRSDKTPLISVDITVL